MENDENGFEWEDQKDFKDTEEDAITYKEVKMNTGFCIIIRNSCQTVQHRIKVDFSGSVNLKLRDLEAKSKEKVFSVREQSERFVFLVPITGKDFKAVVSLSVLSQ